MLGNAKHSLNDSPRVLMVSLRNLKFHVSRCSTYEFEDVVCANDKVDLITPHFSPNLFKVTNKLANYAAKTIGNAKLFPSLLNYKFVVDQEYDLFFFFSQSISDLLVLNSIKGWREKCRYAVCWLDEIWAKDIDDWKAQLQLLKDFDYVFLNLSGSVNRIAKIVQNPCHFLTFGVDTVKFCPYPLDIRPTIDVYSIGRRSLVTHKALLELAERERFFYIYDTIKDLHIRDYREHRSLYSNLVKRSRYMITYKAKFDLGGQINSQEEVGPRFFEAAAGGAVLLGTPPNCEAFKQNFDWEDAMIPVSFDAANIGNVIGDLNAQPERLERIRRNNIANALLRHDWIYRWEQILQVVGLDSTPAMFQRKAYLQNLADTVSAQVCTVGFPP
jgi:hypothetical protein